MVIGEVKKNDSCEVEFIRADKVMEILKGRQLALPKTNQTYWVYEELIRTIEAL